MFRFNPEGPFAWAEAIERHQRRRDGEALAAMICGGAPMPDEARAYVAAIVVRHANRPRGRQAKTLDPATIFRNRRIQAQLAGQVERLATRGRHTRTLEAGQKARDDEVVVIVRPSQDRAVQAVVDAIAGTRDELQRTAVADLARRIARDIEDDEDAAPPASPK